MVTSEPIAPRPTKGDDTVSLTYVRPRKVAFVRAYGPHAVSCERAWGLMLTWLDKRGLTGRLPCGYGLAHDDPNQVATEFCRYDACAELPEDFVENIDDGIGFQMLPGGVYATVRRIGRYADLGPAIHVIRDNWLAEQDHLSLDRRRPVLFTFFDDPRRITELELRCDVCLPVRAPSDDVIPRVRLPVTP